MVLLMFAVALLVKHHRPDFFCVLWCASELPSGHIPLQGEAPAEQRYFFQEDGGKHTGLRQRTMYSCL